jgi:hypothetical protein
MMDHSTLFQNYPDSRRKGVHGEHTMAMKVCVPA